MSGAGKGDIEFVIAVVGFLITVALLAITIIASVTKRGSGKRWFTGTAAAFVVTVGLLTYI